MEAALVRFLYPYLAKGEGDVQNKEEEVYNGGTHKSDSFYKNKLHYEESLCIITISSNLI